MWFLHLHDVIMHFAHMSPYLAEGAITLGAALLVGCAACCACSPSCKEKDDLFHKRVS
jgi:hypothetical protein